MADDAPRVPAETVTLNRAIPAAAGLPAVVRIPAPMVSGP